MTKENDTFNPCADLEKQHDEQELQEVFDKIAEMDGLEFIMTKQMEFNGQLENGEEWYLPKFNPNVEKSVGEVLELLRYSKTHFDREYFELEDALGGMSNGAKVASTVVKPWKKGHLDFINKPYKELSEEDRLEVEYEFIDMFHFYIMMGLAIGITPERIKQLYYLKNKENFDRQERGY